MNTIVISGNVGTAPEMRQTPSGVDVASFSLADNRKRGEEEKTIWYRVTCWRQLGSLVVQYVEKGSNVTVYGTLDDARIYDSKNGPAVSLEVTAQNVWFGPKQETSSSNKPSYKEEIPF